MPPGARITASHLRPGDEHRHTVVATPRAYPLQVFARLQPWLDRHPGVLDAALAAAVFAISLVTPLDQPPPVDAAHVVGSLLLSLPLALRLRAPVAAFAAVMLACGFELLFVENFLGANIAVPIMLYTLTAYAPRRQARLGIAVALVGTVPMALHFDHPPLPGFWLTWLMATGHVALAVALGDRRRVQLRDRAQLEEHARLLAADRDRRAAEAVAAERARIAHELHDVIAHALSAIIAQADGGRYAAGTDPDSSVTALQTIAATAREAQAELRRTLGMFGERDAPLAPQPGIGEIAALVARLRDCGQAIALTERGAAQDLTAAAGLAAYRVVQEGLTNVLKHAGSGASAAVNLSWEPDLLQIVVSDDGAGGGAENDDCGRGIAGMRERVLVRGGTFTAGPRTDGGFELRATIPTAAAAVVA